MTTQVHFLRRALCALFLFVGASLFAKQPVLLEFYFQAGCGECEKVKALVLPRLNDAYSGNVEIRQYAIEDEANYLQLLEALERLQIDSNATASVIVGNKIYLGGFEEIDNKIDNAIREMQDVPDGETVLPAEPDRNASEILQNRARSFSLWAILAAGLIDGINPCVFSTLVFFLSILSMSKMKGKKLLMVGSIYCFASFLTYVLLGLGLFHALKAMEQYRLLQLLLKYGISLLLICASFFSIHDIFRFRRSGNPDVVKLKLPNSIKQTIHSVMKKGLRYRWLVPGAFLVGTLVTLLESVCTGQVYLPTLMLLVKYQEGGVYFLYLLLYNVMFILPLVALFAITYRGINTLQLVQWSKKNVQWGKGALAFIFLLLAVLLVLL